MQKIFRNGLKKPDQWFEESLIKHLWHMMDKQV